MRRTTLVIAAMLLTGAVAPAAERTPPTAVDATGAFNRLKTLVGEWQADTPMGKSRVRYELIANGTALVENETFESMPEHNMLTVYHVDGSRLLLTHYCPAGNQPRMEARSYNPDTGEVGFQFLDATNLSSPKALHMHNAKLRLTDRDHLESEWEVYENGSPKASHPFRFTRVR